MHPTNLPSLLVSPPRFLLALEGGVCSGKTTLVQYLASKFSLSNFPEYYKMLSLDERVLLHSMSQEEQYKWYLRLEYKRSASIAGGTGLIVLDRSFLTLIATQYAYCRMGLADAYIPQSVSTALDRILPLHAVVLINVDFPERQRRWALRATNAEVQIFIDPQFNELFDEFFRKLSAHIPLLQLSSTISTVAELSSRIMQFADSNANSEAISIHHILELRL